MTTIEEKINVVDIYNRALSGTMRSNESIVYGSYEISHLSDREIDYVFHCFLYPKWSLVNNEVDETPKISNGKNLFKFEDATFHVKKYHKDLSAALHEAKTEGFFGQFWFSYDAIMWSCKIDGYETIHDFTIERVFMISYILWRQKNK